MTPLTTTFLALACSVFGTTSELANHGRISNANKLYEGDHMYRTNPRHFYDRLSQNTGMRHFNTEATRTKEMGYLTNNGMRQFNIEAKEAKVARHQTHNTVEQLGMDDQNEISQTNYMRQYDTKSRERQTHRLIQTIIRPSIVKAKRKEARFSQNNNVRHNVNNRGRRQATNRCDPFTFKGKTSDTVTLMPPRDRLNDKNYSSNITCITTISGAQGNTMVLSFVGEFHIEGNMPTCENDYLEIREGRFGYGTPVHKFCGTEVDLQEKGSTTTIYSTGPDMWLKFRSDESVEYPGFQIKIEFVQNSYSQGILEPCIRHVSDVTSGEIGSHDPDVKECREKSPGTLDIQWKLETAPGTSIFLNFTEYEMAKPNDCENNLLQVFGAEPDFDHNLAHYCGSVSKPVTTKLEKEGFGPSNVMYVRLYATKLALDTKFKAQFTAFRTVEGLEGCNEDEFDCGDGTCIVKSLSCEHNVANCRLKTNEQCEEEEKSIAKEPRILVVLGIFSVVLFAVGSFFLFTCIRKLYRDHQYIKETLQAKSQDRLDQISDGELSLDTDHLARDTEPRATLERENFANEMNQRKSGSIDSNYLHPESPHNLDDEWLENRPILSADMSKEYKGRFKRHDTINKEDSPRIVVSNEEEWKENEHQGRHKRKDSNRTHGSLKTKKSIEEELNQTKHRDRPKRSIPSKKESLKPENSMEGEHKEMDHNERHMNYSKKDKLLRSKTLPEGKSKDVDNKSEHRHYGRSKGDLQENMRPTEDCKEREIRHKPKRETSKHEDMSTTKKPKNEIQPNLSYTGKEKESLDSKEEWAENKEIEYKGKLRRDTSKKEESLRTMRSKEESRDVSVGTLDTKEFGCQTRDSLFLLDPVLSSDGTTSSSNSRGLSVFGCSSATIARPRGQPSANTSQITIDLQASPPEPINIHMDRRPMSSETTRSAPDVIIVAKPTQV